MMTRSCSACRLGSDWYSNCCAFLLAVNPGAQAGDGPHKQGFYYLGTSLSPTAVVNFEIAVCALHVPARTNLCTNNRTRVIVITCKLLISCVITAIILFCIIPPTLTEMRAIYWNVRACNGYAESKSHSLNGCVLVRARTHLFTEYNIWRRGAQQMGKGTCSSYVATCWILVTPSICSPEI
jgi:hypothetical protein